jgi:membrane protein YdbS with pleckstrin-like domain
MADVPHAWLLRLLKVPPVPQLPSGDSVRVFRAAPQHRSYLLLLWGLRELGGAAGLLVFTVMLRSFALQVDQPVAERVAWSVGALAWLVFLAQLPIGYLIRHLDYTFRWYVLSDRSLRIREGLVSLQEKTMTFANIQQVSVRQNPLQRLLGIADVKVETAGGGGSSGPKGANVPVGEHLHEAYFRGVDNAAEIRDVILARVRMHRDTGLGEPSALEHAEAPRSSAAALEAARELLAEVRALRRTLPRQPRTRSE